MSDIGEDLYPESGQKFAVVLVVDVSGSMEPHIDQLNASFNEFLDEAKADNDVSTKADIEVITFNHDVKIASPWSDIGGVPYQNFKASGTTNLRDALILAKEEARARTIAYKNEGIRAYTPWIISMTDGYPDSDKPINAIAAELRQREAEGKVHNFALGMGTGFNKTILELITDKTLAITDWDFKSFFGWLGKSLAIVSKSTPGTQGTLCDTGKEFGKLRQNYDKFLGTL